MKISAIRRPIRLLAFLVIVSFLFPAVQAFGFGMKLDFFFVYPLFFIISITDGIVRRASFFKKISVISVFIFLSMALSNNLGRYYFFDVGGIDFPTEFLQILNRVFIFYSFFVIGFYRIFSIRTFKLLTGVVFIISLAFGLFQSLGFPPVLNISTVYALSENQIRGFEGLNTRVFGTSGNILTWAGLCGFFFIYFMILFKDFKLLRFLGIGLSSINLIYAASRGGILALLFALFCYIFLNSIFEKRASRFLLRLLQVIVISSIIGIALYDLFPERIDLMLLRFENLDSEVSDTGRAAQLSTMQQIFSTDSFNYLFGLGKQKVDSIGLMEVEFFFILFAYGLVGVILTYLLIFRIISFGRVIAIQNLDVGLFVLTSFAFYLVFSLGYFFIKEIYSGLLFWYIIGYFLGYYYKKSQ